MKKSMEKTLKLLMVFFLIILAGCTSAPQSVRVAVDSYVGGLGGAEKSYYLEIPGADKVDMELAARNYAVDLDLMLYNQGYRKVFDRKLANYIISFDYSVEGPFSEGIVTQRPVKVGMGIGFGYGSWGYSSRINSGFIGNDFIIADTVEIRELYRKTLYLRAKDKKGVPIWEVRAVNNNSISDMRTVFPYLVAAASNYIGRNSGEVVIVNVPQLAYLIY